MIDADNLYKAVLKKYFWDGLRLFFPGLHEAADRSVAPVSLDKVAYDKRQIVKHVENLKMSKEDRKMYKSVFEEVYTERGVQEGEAKTRVEVAKNLLNMGLPVEQIAQGTGLAENDIKNLLVN